MIPDRLSSSEQSPYFIKDHPMVRVSVDGVEFTGRVLEFCISAGWAMILQVDHKGDPVRGRRGAPSAKIKRGFVAVWLASDPPPPGAILPGSVNPTERHVLGKVS